MFDFITTFPPSPAFPNYDPSDHYWFIRRDRTRAFSSKRGVFVPIEDPEFQAWLERGQSRTTTTDSTAELMGTLWRLNIDYPGLVDRCRDGLGNPPCRRRCKAREFIAALSPDDILSIQQASSANGNVAKLWAMLLSLGEKPVDTKNDTVRAGLVALASVVGEDRVQAAVNRLGLVTSEGQPSIAKASSTPTTPT